MIEIIKNISETLSNYDPEEVRYILFNTGDLDKIKSTKEVDKYLKFTNDETFANYYVNKIPLYHSPKSPVGKYYFQLKNQDL